MGPRMRAKLPALCAMPIVAPCSCAGVSMEIKPKTGGRVKLDPIASTASTISKRAHASQPCPRKEGTGAKPRREQKHTFGDQSRFAAAFAQPSDASALPHPPDKAAVADQVAA